MKKKIIFFIFWLSISWFIDLMTCCMAEELKASIEQPDETTSKIILPSGGPGAATNLKAAVDCDPSDHRKGIAKLTWTIAEGSIREQRIEVTIFQDGFERGVFDSSGPLPLKQNSLVWDKIKGQAFHYWRVMTLRADGWVPSETAIFEGPTCVSDRVKGP